MKRKLLFAAITLLFAVWSGGSKSLAQEAGTYYIQNVGTGKWLGPGNDWGTHASLLSHADYWKLAKISDGVYTMESVVSNGGTNHFLNGSWCDGGATNLTFTALGGNVYNISLGDKYLVPDGDGKYVNADGTDASAGAAKWKLYTEADMLAVMATAATDNPVDATWMILDANFGRNNRHNKSLSNKDKLDFTKNADLEDAWTFTAGNKDNAGAVTNGCVESYHSTFTMSQVIKNAPKGVYKLTAQGFYRQDGGTIIDYPVFYINDVTSTFPLKTGEEGSMTAASNSFTGGSYPAAPMLLELLEGDITVGARLTSSTNLWCIWDNFELTYYGPTATIADVMFGDLNKQVKELRATATELKDNPDVPAANVTALNKALEDTKTIELTEEAYQTAITTLTTAIDAANAFVIAKPILAEMKKVVDATNFYTAEACETYYGQWAAKYDDGTLTLAEAQALQNPSVGTDWHASITVDNFLLSAWDTNPDFNNAPYYINSWSTEGNGDGSNFRVPFFEYWTGDANSLGVRTLSGTMTELPAGYYKVTAWVRVRANNNNVTNPKGVTMQLNETLPLDVTTGGRVGESNFYLKEFTAYGKVGADGKLIAKFNVEAGNTISWLSFKNVKYATATEAEYREYLQAALAEGIAKYNIWKEQAEALAAVPYLDKYEAEHTQLNNVITTQTTAVGNAETAADIEDAIAAVIKAMTDYVFVAEPQEGEDNKFDLTFLMTNPDLTNLPSWQKAEGWTTEQEDGNYQVMDNDKATSEDGTKTKFYEYWSYNAKDNDKFNLYNKITLTKGTYTMSCYAFVKQQDGEAGKDPKEEVYFYANETQGSKVTTERLTKQEISFFNETENPDGVEVKIGLKPQAGNTYNWMGIGYVELYKEFTDWHEYDIAQEKGEFTYAVATANGSGKTSMAKKNVTVNVEMPEMEEGEEFNIEVIVTQEDGTVVAKGNVNAEGAFTYQQPRADVTVTVARETKEIAMEFYKPSDDRYKYAFATFIAPFNVDIAEYSKDIQAAYTVDDVTDGELDMTEVEDGIIPAYTPVILECKKMKSVVPVTFTDNVVKPTKSAPYTEGLLTGVLKATDAPVGTYVLQEQDDQLAFYQVDKEKPIKVPAYKAYLTMPGSSAKAIFFPSDEEETAIKTLDVLTSGYDAIYTANGVQVNALQKGLNIVKKGGKSYKIFVK